MARDKRKTNNTDTLAESLSIETLPVEIHVIRVGGHKMTMSVFSQIQYLPRWAIIYGGTDGKVGATGYAPDVKILGWVVRRSETTQYFSVVALDGKIYKDGIFFEPNAGTRSDYLLKRIQSEYPQLFIAT